CLASCTLATSSPPCRRGSLPYLLLFLHGRADHRALHSFPTRRSSDLSRGAPAKAPAHTSGVATGRGTGRGPALRVTHSIMPTSPFPVRSRAGTATGAVGRPRGRSVSPAPIFPPPGRGGGSHAGRWLVPCAPEGPDGRRLRLPRPARRRVPRGPRTPYVPRGPHPYGWPNRRRSGLPAVHGAPNR